MTLLKIDATFGNAATPPARDAFEVVTGEVLAREQAASPERRFLVDESIVHVAETIHGGESTTAQKDVAQQPYVGRWLLVRFAVGDHVSRFGMEIVHAAHPASSEGEHPGTMATPQRLGLTCLFETAAWGGALAALEVGATVTVAGQIDVVGEYAVRLRNCELVP